MCTSTSKIIEPVRSRCLSIRIPAPSLKDVQCSLEVVAKKENKRPSDEFLRRIAVASKRNMRRALLMLEATAFQK
jgi:replication factor C subunit 3/5